MHNNMDEEINNRVRAGWASYNKYREFLNDKKITVWIKKRIFDMCILPTMTYGCQTWTLTNQRKNKLRSAQRAMERRMLNISIRQRIPHKDIRRRTGLKDIVEHAARLKWKWAGHVARLRDDRWTKRCTEWRPHGGKRNRGRQPRRWRDDINEVTGTIWQRHARDRNEWIHR